MGPAAAEFGPQCGEQREVLLVDRALATEVVIVFGDLEHPLSGHVPAAEHIFEKRHDVTGAIGATEGDEQDRVVRRSRFGGLVRRSDSLEFVHGDCCAGMPADDPTGIRTPVTAVKGQCPNH